MSKPVIAVAFYSTWGHIAQLAERVIKGVEGTGAIVKPYVFQETLSEEILTKMHAGSSLKPKYPVLTPNDLKEVDGLIIGAPTRYGRLPAQVSAFFDACGQLWATGALVGKFVTMFTSCAGQHGGHETTALTSMPFFVHQGMVFVPLGYTNPSLHELNTVIGGAPWGASTLSGGDGSRQPLEIELSIAESQGKFFGDFVSTFVRGKHLQAGSTGSTGAPTLGAATTAPAAKALPEKVTEKDGEQGYDVPKTEAPASTTAAATTPAAATPAPAAATTAPAEPTAPAATPTAPAAKKEKKGGLFASCCGGRGIDD